MRDFWDAWWQQTYQVKSIVLGNVRMLKTTPTMEVYLVSLLPPSFKVPHWDKHCHLTTVNEYFGIGGVRSIKQHGRLRLGVVRVVDSISGSL